LFAVELIDDAGAVKVWGAQKIATSCGPKTRSGNDKSHAVCDANAMGDPAECRGVRAGIVMGPRYEACPDDWLGHGAGTAGHRRR